MPRTAVLGVGSEFNGDDAAGIVVVRRLLKGKGEMEALLAVEGGAAPENATATLRRFAPELVIFVDCADMDAAPGTIAWLDVNDLDGLSATTHSLPLSVLAKYLQTEIGCEIGLIGIQPETLAFGAPFSPPVQRAVKQVAAELRKLFRIGGGDL